jgi:hypothetical protein
MLAVVVCILCLIVAELIRRRDVKPKHTPALRKATLTHTLLMGAMTEANIRVMQNKPRATTKQVLEDWRLK